MALVECDLLQVGVAEAVVPALLLEPRECGALGEKVAGGPVQVLSACCSGCTGASAGQGAMRPLGIAAPWRQAVSSLHSPA